MKILILITVILLLMMSSISYAQSNTFDMMKTTANDNYNFISVNQIKMWVSNNGDGSYNPVKMGSGFHWPYRSDSSKTAIYADGLIWGGYVDGELKVNGTTWRVGLQAGKILSNGLPENDTLSKNRIYKIKRGWENLPSGIEREKYKSDYMEWPIEDGAPWIDVYNDGSFNAQTDIPKHIGDETLWYVANDMDTSRTLYTFGCTPIGLEFQTTIYAFDSSNFLADVVFKKYLIVNKSGRTIDSMYFTYWYDDDLGDANNDYSGCDTSLSLGYTYNGYNSDGNGSGVTYGTPPPAVGHMFLQGPRIPSNQNDSAYFMNEWIKGFRNNLISSYTFYLNGYATYSHPQLGTQSGALGFYNNMRGLMSTGAQYINPINHQVTVFPVSGDPVTGTGWYEGDGWPSGYGWSNSPYPGQRYAAINSGPFTMAANDTQEVVIAIFAARGTDNINSITELRNKARLIKDFHYSFKADYNDISSPDFYHLFQNYPNPFNPSTTIWYEIPVSGFVSLKMYDILGNEIATLINEDKREGRYSIKFNGANLASGVYFYQLQAGQFIQTRKMLLLK